VDHVKTGLLILETVSRVKVGHQLEKQECFPEGRFERGCPGLLLWHFAEFRQHFRQFEVIFG